MSRRLRWDSCSCSCNNIADALVDAKSLLGVLTATSLDEDDHRGMPLISLLSWAKSTKSSTSLVPLEPHAPSFHFCIHVLLPSRWYSSWFKRQDYDSPMNCAALELLLPLQSFFGEIDIIRLLIGQCRRCIVGSSCLDWYIPSTPRWWVIIIICRFIRNTNLVPSIIIAIIFIAKSHSSAIVLRCYQSQAHAPPPPRTRHSVDRTLCLIELKLCVVIVISHYCQQSWRGSGQYGRRRSPTQAFGREDAIRCFSLWNSTSPRSRQHQPCGLQTPRRVTLWRWAQVCCRCQLKLAVNLNCLADYTACSNIFKNLCYCSVVVVTVSADTVALQHYILHKRPLVHHQHLAVAATSSFRMRFFLFR